MENLSIAQFGNLDISYNRWILKIEGVEFKKTALGYLFSMVDHYYTEYHRRFYIDEMNNTNINIDVDSDNVKVVLYSSKIYPLRIVINNELEHYFTPDEFTKLHSILRFVMNIPMSEKHEMQQYIQSKIEKGVRCPVCDNNCKQYKRAFNDNMAKALSIIVHNYECLHRKTHTNEIMQVLLEGGKSIGDTSKIKFWGLVETYGDDMQESPSGSYLKPTKKGIDFVKGNIRIPKYTFLYQNKVKGFSDETVNYKQTLKTPFNIDEVMSNGKVK